MKNTYRLWEGILVFENKNIFGYILGVPLDGRSMLLELMGEPLAYQGNDERRGGYRQRGNFRDGHDDTGWVETGSFFRDHSNFLLF